MATYLGFDFGYSRIGVAVGQSVTCTAHPLPVLLAKKGQPSWELIKQLNTVWDVHACVVGVPFHMDGKEQTTTRGARAFIDLLKSCLDKPVYEAEERLTTRAARAHAFEQGGFHALQTVSIDSLAAQFILEHWMSLYV